MGVATAVSDEGHRELLGLDVVSAESAATAFPRGIRSANPSRGVALDV